MKRLRVGFMGTPDFACTALKALDDSAHEVAVVYSQPPRPKGRGHKVQPSPVHEYAQTKGMSVLTPTTLKTQEAQAEFAAHNLDVVIVAAYGLILPKAILDAPKYGCLNIHASLLPRWRGASPIQQAIWKGDTHSGISIMQMDEGLDTGPVIAERICVINSQTTTTSMHDELSEIGGGLLVEVLERLAEDGHLVSVPQNASDVTYAPLLSKEDGRVDWGQSAAKIERQIRALNPWPGVFTEIGGKRVKILSAALTNEHTDESQGKIITRTGDVACGDGQTLRLIKIQPHGSKAMDFASAINGGHLAVGGQCS